MPEQTETRLPWGQETITIQGRNAGIDSLTVFFDEERLNIVDFLNHSLKAEYAAIYEDIMSHYEAKLKGGDIFAHNFPEAKIICKEINAAELENNPTHPHSDKGLTETLLKEYHVYLDDLKTCFKHYEAHVERWYNGLPGEDKAP